MLPELRELGAVVRTTAGKGVVCRMRKAKLVTVEALAVFGALLVVLALSSDTSRGSTARAFAASARSKKTHGAPVVDSLRRHSRIARCRGARERHIPDVLPVQLRSAAFPDSGNPDAAVHVPPDFDGTNAPGLVVFVHGFEACVVNLVGVVDAPCTPDALTRDAFHLAEQLDAARVNAILVAPQLRFDLPTGDPGALATPGQLRALLHELFTEQLDPMLGCALDVDDFERVVVVSHSGGYQATAAMLSVGGVPLREIVLFDSLYGEMATFGEWIGSQPARFDPMKDDDLRFVNLYTCCGGTQENSRAMASGVARALSDAWMPGSLFDDDTTTPLSREDAERPVVIKLVDAPHADVPKLYFRQVVEAAGFTPLR